MRIAALLLSLPVLVLAACASPPAPPVPAHTPAPPSPSPSASATCEIDAVTYLRTKYDEVFREPDGGTVLVGLAYIPERAPLVPLSSPALARRLPDTRFFTTFVATPHMEYQRVETLVSVRRTAAGIDVRSTLSPLYTDASPKFLEQFTGLEARSEPERAELVQAIGSLLAAITYEGRIKDLAHKGSSYTAQLWHGEQHWRDVLVSFTPEGRILSVSVIKPG